jgi:hypothetical protein
MTDVTPAPEPAPAEVDLHEKPARNGVGIAGLVLVILSFVAPIAIIIIGLAVSNNYSNNNSTGTGGLVIGAIIAVVAAGIVAIILDAFGIILGIVSLFRTGKSKVVGIVAIVLGLIPAAASFGIFSFFGNAFTGSN